MTQTTSTYDPPTHEGRESGWHPVNVGHLVMGVAFLGILAVWALYETGVVETGDLRWFLPVPWLAAGLAGIAAMTFGPRRTTSPTDTTTIDTTTDTTQEER
jgi:hypothetical protein